MNESNPSRHIEGAKCPVVVVGGAGFLGSHLVEYLLEERGCPVLVLDNLSSGQRDFIPFKAEFIHADITRDEARLTQLFQSFRAQYIFNYAAEPYIPVSFQRPAHVFSTNAVGAINVINAAWNSPSTLGILQVSSAEIYGHQVFNGKEVAYVNCKISESSDIVPHSTYGVAKAAVDHYCQTSFRERLTPVIALRQFNCVGERETHPYVVPEIISQLTTAREQAKLDWAASPLTKQDGPHSLTVRLGNNSSRDFMYAGDAVRLAVALLEKGKWGEVYNLGSQESVKIHDLAPMIGKLMGFNDVKVEEDPLRKRPWEIWHLQSDNSKLYGTITQRPTICLKEALRRTIKYYEDNGRAWPWEKK